MRKDLFGETRSHFISFQDISELLLFLLLPEEDFSSLHLRTLVRELLVNVVLKPVLDLVSDPDFINQNLVWLYQDLPIKPDLLSLTIRHSESAEELQATRESVTSAMASRRACGGGSTGAA